MKIFILLVFYSFNTYALDSLYEFSGKKFDIKTLDNRRIVNSQCSKDCIAKTVDIIAGEVEHGEDPAAIACLQKMGGGVLQMHDGKQNEVSVCIFKDGSFLTFDSIRGELYFKE